MNRIARRRKRGLCAWLLVFLIILFVFVSTFIFIVWTVCQKVSFYEHQQDLTFIPPVLPKSRQLLEFCDEFTRRIALEQQNQLRNISIRLTPSRPIPYSYSQWRSSPTLTRALTPCEHAITMHLITLIVNLFHNHNISYTMMAATLLGNIFENSYTELNISFWSS
jgi:hypothetical protein